MVQKYQSPVRVYKYPFELIMLAYERRFPTCPQMPIVIDCQIINDELIDDGAIRNTKRRCKLAVEAPYLFKKLIGLDFVYFIQTNFLDMRARSLNIEAVNETYSSRIEIFERCRYYAHPENPEWTCFDQTATLDIKNFLGFEHSMEKMGMKQYTQTTLKGKEIIESFIEELRKEGITSAECWQPSTPLLDTNFSTITNNINTNICDDDNSIDKSVESPTSLEHQDVSRKPSISEYEDMLNADYIQKNLGSLEPLQESQLLELRGMIKDTKLCKKIPKYETLLRFLRARDFNVEKSYQMLMESLAWRNENNIDRILNDYKIPTVIDKYFPGEWHECDKDGRPMYILRLGQMDVKGILKAIGEDGLLKLTLHICEEGLQLIEEATKRLEKPITTWCLLVDLDGLSMRHLWRPGIKALLHIIETVEKNYPETMGRVFIVRAPRVFPIGWTIVSAFIDINTRSKFLFYGGPDCLHMKDGLEVYIDSKSIPDFLGGPCSTLIHEGGIVPKTLYKTMSEDDTTDNRNGSGPGGINIGNSINTTISQQINNGTNIQNSLYTSVDLKPGQLHELVIANNDPKSVLTWDFDVLRKDLHFTIYRTHKHLSGYYDASVSVFDSSGFEEDKNYFKAEPTLICHQKESIQGSHIMTYTCNYILQWYCPPSGDSPSQLMYFHEILSSENYKGSMSSLQSGISSMSLSSSCQSR